MWVELVVLSLPCSERHFLAIRFSPLVEKSHF